MKSALLPLCCLVALLAPVVAQAQYSLPWQLRPTAAVNVVRSDTAFVSHKVQDEDATTVATLLLASYKVRPNLSPLVRLGMVHNRLAADGATSLVNPALGGTWSLQLTEPLRLALFLGLTFPVGMGGGDDPDPERARAARAGVLARSAMDNAMFAVNDFTVFPGAGLSFVHGRFSAQAEMTVLQLTRVRGSQAQADSSRTNFTSGLHLGVFAADWVSFGAELRYQRWLSTPVAVSAAPSTRDNLTMAGGPRFHFKAGGLTLRPGLAFAIGLDDPMSAQRYRIVQLDVPILF